MKNDQVSSTAYLVAESLVFLADDARTRPLLEPQIAYLSECFAEARSFSARMLYRAKRSRALRPLFSSLEKLIIPGIQLHYAVRKRRLEEIAVSALEDGFEQVVIFGAGFDTLALRLHSRFPDVTFIETDHPSTQIVKRQVAERYHRIADNLNFIPVDLSDDSYPDVLATHPSFRKGARTLFIAEGLLMYLEETGIERLFNFFTANSSEGSRFAFTFMESSPDGRIAFANSSKFVDVWLRINGEPFTWAIEQRNLETFLRRFDLSIESVDNAATFRERYLSGPEFRSLLLAEGEALCVAAFNRTTNAEVNDIHSKLNRTSVSNVLRPSSADDICSLVADAQRTGKHISIAGGFHSMGGQQFLEDEILLDMRGMNRVLEFQPEDKLIKVEGGMHWHELIAYTATAPGGGPAGIRQKQTGADRLSIGGALSSNIHGRGLTMKPFIDDIESFEIVTADGEVRNCSRNENRELFALAIGGYGLFGIVVSVTLRLAPRVKIERVVQIETVENLERLFAERIEDGFEFGDFQFAIDPLSEDFLKRGVFSCYRPVADDTPISDAQIELCVEDWTNLLVLAHTDKSLAFQLYSSHYLRTDRQIYWSDSHQLSTYIDDYHSQLDTIMRAAHRCSEMITEVYVPIEKLTDFFVAVREDFRHGNVNLIYGTVRLIKRDDESFLAWAKEDYACIVFNLHVEHSAEGIAKAKNEFRRLIDRALERGGSYYLTYHSWAEKDQVTAAYPQMSKFLQKKMAFDPEEIFQSNWYRGMKKMFGD